MACARRGSALLLIASIALAAAACSLAYPIDDAFFSGADAASDGNTDGAALACARRLALTTLGRSLALDDASAWMTTNEMDAGAVIRIPLDKTGPVVMKENAPTGIAADATHAYWTTADGTLRRLARDSSNPETIASGILGTTADLVLDDSYVYATRRVPDSKGSVARVPKAGGSPTYLPDISGGGEVHIALGGDGVVYLAQNVQGLWRGQLPGGTVCDLSDPTPPPATSRGVTVANGRVFFGSNTFGPSISSLISHLTTGCDAPPSVSLTVDSSIIGVASDGDFMFLRTRAGVEVYQTSVLQKPPLLSCPLPAGSSFNDLQVRTIVGDATSRKVYTLGIDGVYEIAF